MQSNLVDRRATEVGTLYQKAKKSLVESTHCLLECGRKLKEKRDSLAHGQWLPWLKENEGALGFRERTAQLLIRGYESNTKLTSDLDEAQATAITRQIWGNKSLDTIVTKWTGDPDWYTPAQYVNAARIVMGGIDLDPASNAVAQKTVKAKRYFSERDDGLRQRWQGRVFLNPPYKQPDIKHFIDKLLESLENGLREAVLLTNNNTDTDWFHKAARRSTLIAFTDGRISFYKPDGRTSSPTNGQSFFYFGDNADGFRRTFSEFCLVVSVKK